MEFERSYTPRLKLSLTPLIDMVFLLVVFFMLTSTFTINEGIELNFSQEAAESATGDVRTIEVIVETGGKVLIDNQEFDYALFGQTLTRILYSNSKRQIVVKTVPGVSVQELMTVVDKIQVAGGKNITFVEQGE